ncbi:MFS transporter [Bradyrhizobium sp. WYCCWR 13022]|uniref:MFS transporter n=1 Tax=unclassified Bradyrhizobium TaxID=2631580 RepID=UPI00263B7D4B|nr:MFS transporter [Bradyrhizobium sp. WYCCWR 13022]MDN4984320.1 MFS transporter [Bradyrhizobium sp. WYCCWR 13022]
MARRSALVSFVGSMLEYYDFIIYGAAAAFIFPKIFFVGLDPATATLVSLASFGVAFVARPVGAVVIGHFGDRVGRKSVLVFTLLMMGFSTLAIGLLPDARTIGNAAPVILVILRLLQGLSAAGEQSGSNSLTLEHASSGNRAFFTSWTLSGVQAGAILAKFAFIPVAALPQEQLLNWGWRIPFLLSFVVLVVAYLVRRRMPEAPEFARLKDRRDVERFPIVMLVRDYWAEVSRVVVCSLISCISSLTTVFALSYGTAEFHVPGSIILWAGVLGNALALVVQPFWAILGDRVGRKPVFIVGSVGCALTVFPYFMAISSGNSLLIFGAAMLMSGIFYGATNAIWPSFFGEMFETRVRYSGMAVGTNLGFLAAGFTPAISQSLMQSGPTGWLPVAIFIGSCCIAAAVSAATARETHAVRLNDLGRPAADETHAGARSSVANFGRGKC